VGVGETRGPPRRSSLRLGVARLGRGVSRPPDSPFAHRVRSGVFDASTTRRLPAVLDRPGPEAASMAVGWAGPRPSRRPPPVEEWAGWWPAGGVWCRPPCEIPAPPPRSPPVAVGRGAPGVLLRPGFDSWPDRHWPPVWPRAFRLCGVPSPLSPSCGLSLVSRGLRRPGAGPGGRPGPRLPGSAAPPSPRPPAPRTLWRGRPWIDGSPTPAAA